jgi:dienelactone hydrolase
MYLRDSRVLDYLLTRSDWDSKTIVLMGGSMGGQQSLVLAGLRPSLREPIRLGSAQVTYSGP